MFPPPDLPDYADLDAALLIAQRAARTTDPALADRLETTAVFKDNETIYRPYHAAFRFLRAHPLYLQKGGGAEFRTLNGVLAGLLNEQASIDLLLGLELPPWLIEKPEIDRGVPGPVLQPWSIG